MTMQINKLKRNLKLRDAGTEAQTIDFVQGIYNQPLFDLCADDAIVALTLYGSYNKALDAIGFETSDVYRIQREFISYIAPSGTATGEPVSSDHADACAPGTGTEFGTCTYILDGWGRLRKTTDTRDITDIGIRYCDRVPTYDIGGQKIDDDYEWDMVQLYTVLLQDLQRRVIDGNKSVPGQANGLLQSINYGYVNPSNGEECTNMDSTVVDWNENTMYPEGGATGVTVNGVAIKDGASLYTLIASFLRKTRQRITNSSLSGTPKHIGLLPTELLNSLIETYVCFTHCGGNKAHMFESEVQAILVGLKNDLMSREEVVLSFYGIPVTFYAYDFSLLGEVNTDGEQLGHIIILTTDVGTTPMVRIQVKDMTKISSHPAVSDAAGYMSTDGGRLLTWKSIDHTCYRLNAELQWRINMPGTWAQMRIMDVACGSILGALSDDPLSDFFAEKNKVASPKAKNFIPEVVDPEEPEEPETPED